jgi:hypothetical protein
VSWAPSDAPLEYYFRRYGVPDERWSLNGGAVNRVFVIVNAAENQTVETVLEGNGICDVDLSSLRIVQRYESATLYELAVAYITPQPCVGTSGPRQRESQRQSTVPIRTQWSLLFM